MASSDVWRHALPLVVAVGMLGTGSGPLAAGEAGLADGSGTALLSAPLSAPMRTLKVATLDLPRPIGTMRAVPDLAAAPAPEPPAPPATPDRAFQYPPLLVLADPQSGPDAPPATAADSASQDTDDAGDNRPSAHLELALDLLLELPGIQDDGAGLTASTSFGIDFDGMEAADVILPPVPETVPEDAPPSDALTEVSPGEAAEPAILHDTTTVFASDPRQFPPLAFEYHALADQGFVPQPLSPPAPAPTLAPAMAEEQSPERDGIWPSPAQRLALQGANLARAQKCLAEAVYFESRGEPKRGQIAVAQVIVNRVFSGYYPADVCGTVYQNASRHLACQFTFACDNVKDVIREPDMWVQAKQIAADMLDGKLWLDSVGRATHYHAYWVHPSWVREMNKLDRIGVHTFYRPRRWQG
ncbi:cell wall hydrolase [Xanthobacter agilis]|uniref:Spore germination cell wall hydrolase CwlJ-like protein n=1 Tax=Xanthobacter agilis TaxID=47492 RepID=A0ABU0LEA7_XANAG|nr:cell wall hydrolase [Xanthobacter agilis]MDQ0505471.1 spore germination cell wall hydrolase CwlJ-like protein [Xanthobacter agilis]